MSYFRVISAVYIIMRDGNKVLLLQRNNTGYHDGNFSLPAGHVDGGEKLNDASVREAKEELGISINATALRLVHVMHRKSDKQSNDNERLDFYFEADSWSGEVSNMEPEKCSSLVWCAIDELPANMVPTVRSALSSVGSGDLYSNSGWNN